MCTAENRGGSYNGASSVKRALLVVAALGILGAISVLVGVLTTQHNSSIAKIDAPAETPAQVVPAPVVLERPTASVQTNASTVSAVQTEPRLSEPSVAPIQSADRAPGSKSPLIASAIAAPARSVIALRQEGVDPVERAMASLATDRDLIGQLLLLGWEGSTAEQADPEIADLRAGGIVFVANADRRQLATAINAGLLQLSAASGLLPPLLAIDHEGGSVQRIRDIPNLGSSRRFADSGPSERQACQRGLEHARQLREMGFSMNLAPVLDVNNNPSNPVIGDRSYSADPGIVATLGSAYVRGLQAGGVAAVGKHFPGHGNTAVDSHLQLPVLSQTIADLERIELVPFRRAIPPPTSIAAIMTAHIAFPALDPSGRPATLSRAVITDLLRGQLRYDGLVVSDDLTGMRAITDEYADGEAAVHAITAGVDMLILSGGAARQRIARDALLSALSTGQLTRERLTKAVRRVVEVKVRFGLLGATAGDSATCD